MGTQSKALACNGDRDWIGRGANEKGCLQGHYLAGEATVGAQPSSGGEGFLIEKGNRA